MTDPTASVPPPEAAPISAETAPAAPAGGVADPPMAQQAVERRIHVYEAAANQRERVLTSFHEQREAIVKAVAEQRAATIAPIEAVRARQAMTRPAAAQRAAAPQAAAAPRPAIAGEIVAMIKLLIAEEVHAQLQRALTPHPTPPAPSAAARTDVPGVDS